MTDDQLIAGILNGDQKCFKELVDKYQPLVLNTCHSFLHSKSDAEDVAQEVFIQVFLSVHTFKKEAKLSTWLYRISINKALNFIRDNKKRKIFQRLDNFFSVSQTRGLQIADDTTSYYEGLDAESERIALLHKSIRELPENQKIAFTLNHFENLPYAEIAEVMNVSLSSVEGLIHRARVNVRKKILNFYHKT